MWWTRIIIIGLGLIGIFGLPLQAQTKIEVAHWWTSRAEAKAISVIKQAFEQSGDIWVDSGIIGGAGDPMVEILKNRITTGNPPSAVQALIGHHLWQWAERDVLMSLDEIAAIEKWEDTLPPLVVQMIQYEGHYVAVPFNLHRVNWMWTSPEIFKNTKTEVPKTWDEFFVSAEKIQKAGFVPVAMGEEPWQVATLFEAVAIGLGKGDFYQRALIELDLNTIQSEMMIEVFQTMRKIRAYTNKQRQGMTWDRASSMVIKGQAAMQFMGDWAKGEVLAVGLSPGKEIGCFLIPQTQGIFLFVSDTFAMLNHHDPKIQLAQQKLAKMIMQPEIQERFNRYKGSIPVRQDVDLKNFDACGQRAKKDFEWSEKNKTLFPSFAFGLSAIPEIRTVILELINKHFDSDMSAEAAVKKMVALVKAAQ